MSTNTHVTRLIEFLRRTRSNTSRILSGLQGGLYGGRRIPGPSTVATAARLGLVPSRGTEPWSRIFDEWMLLDREYARGRYHDVVRRQRELLNEVYGLSGVHDAEFAPPLISGRYTTNIGHLGWLAILSRSMDVGLVPKRDFAVIDSGRRPNEEFFSIATEGMKLVPARSLTPRTDLWEWPIFWTSIDLLQIVRTHGDFSDFYRLLDVYFREHFQGPFAQPLKLPASYRERARAALGALGLPDQCWFVAVHVRKSNRQRDSRFADIGSYSEAAEIIVRNGGFVVQFGAPHTPDVLAHPRVINLSTRLPGLSNLDVFAMAEARFMITTQSGVNPVAALFGTPLLVTNVISLGRSALRLSRNTRYLPKGILDSSGRELSLASILHSDWAYWEGQGTAADRRRMRHLVPNSGSEVARAVSNMLDDLEGRNANETQEVSDQLRRQLPPTPATGAFDLSYLLDRSSTSC